MCVCVSVRVCVVVEEINQSINVTLTVVNESIRGNKNRISEYGVELFYHKRALE